MQKSFWTAAALALGVTAALPAVAQQNSDACPPGEERIASGDCQDVQSNASENKLGAAEKSGAAGATTGVGGATSGTGADAKPHAGGSTSGQ